MMQQYKVIGVKELYQAYVDKLLKENPGYWTAQERQYWRVPRYYVYKEGTHRSGGTTTVEVINYARFRKIVEVHLKHARRRIINGEAYQLWNGIGTISCRRVERNFNKKKVNWKLTREMNLRNPETGKLIPQYWTSPDWCRIGWNLPKGRKGKRLIRQYEFKPADGEGKGGFKDEFRAALDSNEMLRYTYDYHPYNQEA